MGSAKNYIHEQLMRNICDTKGGVNSVYPCTEYLTFGPWLYMVPQYKPEDVLMLGYAGGTTAGLIRLFYGNIPIVAVDIDDTHEDYYKVDFIKQDARDYVKGKRTFDCVIVDTYDDGAYKPCDFINDKEFVDDLKRIARYIIVHAKDDTDVSNYGKPLKVLQLNDSRFYYYMVYEIPTLLIR
jgi:hypothetical protein